MGGLMARAAGALSNCANALGRAERCGMGAGLIGPGASSIAEWQMSQAEQGLVWWLWLVQASVPSGVPWQADASVASDGAWP